MGRLSFFSISNLYLIPYLTRCREENVKRCSDAKKKVCHCVMQYRRNEIVKGCIDGNVVFSIAGHIQQKPNLAGGGTREDIRFSEHLQVRWPGTYPRCLSRQESLRSHPSHRPWGQGEAVSVPCSQSLHFILNSEIFFYLLIHFVYNTAHLVSLLIHLFFSCYRSRHLTSLDTHHCM